METGIPKHRVKVSVQKRAARTAGEPPFGELARHMATVEWPGQAGNSDVSDARNSDAELDQRMLGIEKGVGTAFYRNILREYGRVNQPS